jgi:hypothetical protein
VTVIFAFEEDPEEAADEEGVAVVVALGAGLAEGAVMEEDAELLGDEVDVDDGVGALEGVSPE